MLEHKRTFLKQVIDLIKPKIEYIQAGIFEHASVDQHKYMSNLNAVPKPSSTDFLFGKADRELIMKTRFVNTFISKFSHWVVNRV